MGGMGVRVHETSASHFPLTDKLKESTTGGVLEFTRLNEPPDGTVPACSMTGATSLTERISICTFRFSTRAAYGLR